MIRTTMTSITTDGPQDQPESSGTPRLTRIEWMPMRIQETPYSSGARMVSSTGQILAGSSGAGWRVEGSARVARS